MAQLGESFQIYVDDVLVYEVDANLAWWSTSAEIPLYQGLHHIRLVYSKDALGRDNCDCVIVDTIRVRKTFP